MYKRSGKILLPVKICNTDNLFKSLTLKTDIFASICCDVLNPEKVKKIEAKIQYFSCK